jgi:cytochrome c oxidase subunit IV
MTTLKASTWQWLILLLLTAVTFGLSEFGGSRFGLSSSAVLIPVLLVTLLKGRMVVDRFMALQGVGGPWRWIVLGWLLLVIGLIGVAFRSAQI